MSGADISNEYRPGDHYIICDVCGFKVRSSASRARWDGARVCEKDWEPRHSQDSVRGRVDRQRVSNPRPEATDVFLDDNDVTAADL